MPNNSKRYQKELSDFVLNKSDDFKIFVMNVEALSTHRGEHVAKVFLDKNPENIVQYLVISCNIWLLDVVEGVILSNIWFCSGRGGGCGPLPAKIDYLNCNLE